MFRFVRRALISVELSLLLCPFSTKAQQPAFSASSLLSQSSILQWTGDNGLVSNNITSAIRDHNGFVWITSYNGIMRFDGIQVYVYDKSKIPFLSTGAFYGVYEAKDGTLWFTSQSSGLIKYSGEKFERIDPEHKILPNSIRSLHLAEDGKMWIGSNNSGLFRMSGNTIEKIDDPDLNDRSILDLAVDRDNILWIGTDGKGLYRYDGKMTEHIAGVSSTIINSVCISHDNTALIGTPNGLDVIAHKKISRHPRLTDYQVNK
ncbi:MAG TPA: two-component regulator propeller domain-containing protein, partial [Cyclobacteriaceae bacterium]|nr:two-component regulator propeller domain-containing protein [Cyclobacteriaceae bacterium]